jgi:hypothetical protein
MRLAVMALCLSLAACATAPAKHEETLSTVTLNPVDAATNLISWGPLTVTRTATTTGEGQDPLITLVLTRPDGQVMRFTAANHTPQDVMTQEAGGPLAQAMGFFGEEKPELFHAAPEQPNMFICPPTGAVSVGLFETEGGAVTMIGLSEGFAFETDASGAEVPAPVSPSIVCARMKFRRG